MVISQKWIKQAVFVLLLIGLSGLAYAHARARSAPPTIKIGLVAPFEGLYRSSGYEVLFAVKIALQERNQGRGLQGYRVELTALNDFNEPGEAARQARVLVTDPDILGVVGHLTSASTLAASPIYQEAQLAMVIPWSIESSAFQAENQGLAAVAATLEEAGDRLEAVSQAMGLDRFTSLTQADFKTIPQDVQALYLATDAVTAGDILLKLRSSDNTLPLFGQVETGNLQLIQVAGPAANGFTFVSPGPAAADVPGSETFREAYQKMAGLPPTPRAVLAYDAANVLLDSIEQAIIMNDNWFDDQTRRVDVWAALNKVRRQGLSGRIAFDSLGRRLDAPVWVYQISEANYPGTLIAP